VAQLSGVERLRVVLAALGANGISGGGGGGRQGPTYLDLGREQWVPWLHDGHGCVVLVGGDAGYGVVGINLERMVAG